MSVIGRRGSRESSWTWFRPPPPRRPPPGPFLVPFAGAVLVFALIGLAFLVSALDDARGSAAPATPTAVLTATAEPSPEPSPSPTPTSEPTPSPTPTATPSPSPTPTPTPTIDGDLPRFLITVWDGEAWRFSPPPAATYREGEAVPLMLRFGSAEEGRTYPISITYDCHRFAFLTAFSRDAGDAPALASGGPASAFADSAISVPDDPSITADDAEPRILTLWGGIFGAVGGPSPPFTCIGNKTVTVELTAAAGDVYLLFGAILADGAGDASGPAVIFVTVPGGRDLSIEIEADSIEPAS